MKPNTTKSNFAKSPISRYALNNNQILVLRSRKILKKEQIKQNKIDD